MNTLKGFVRQRARPEGSMAEGWLVQESLVVITEFLGSTNTEMPRLWYHDTDVRVVGEEPQGKGVMRKMDGILRDKVMKFCILNSEPMQKWIKRYEVTKQERLQERVRFRRNQTTRNLSYPKHLKPLPKFPTGRWLHANHF